jgi:hypothetical protein
VATDAIAPDPRRTGATLPPVRPGRGLRPAVGSGPPKRTTARWWACLATATVLVSAAACGSSPAPTRTPGEAADALAQNLGLTEDQTSCMRSQFERAPGAVAVLDTEAAPDDADRDRFLLAIRECLPPEAFGTTLAATVRSELPEATEVQATCVHDNVVALSGPEQDRLYLYFSNPATLDVADLGPAGADLLASCDLGSTIADDAPVSIDPSGRTTTVAG